MKVKICGMREVENIRAVARLRPDYLGFIFVPWSKRYVGAQWSGFPKEELPPGVESIGVFVDESLETVVRRVKQYALDGVQLHGKESADYITALRHDLPGIVAIKAVRVTGEEALRGIEEYPADLLILDSAAPGSGEGFDWSLLSQMKVQRPYLLAGGIGLSEVQRIKQSGIACAGVDLNSKVESAPGVKSEEVIREILKELGR